jgi:hypothetical protein
LESMLTGAIFSSTPAHYTNDTRIAIQYRWGILANNYAPIQCGDNERQFHLVYQKQQCTSLFLAPRMRKEGGDSTQTFLGKNIRGIIIIIKPMIFTETDFTEHSPNHVQLGNIFSQFLKHRW